MTWTPDGPQGNEAEKIKHLIVPYTMGTGLDIGCGIYKAFPHFIGIDSGKQWGQSVSDISGDGAKLLFADKTMDFVFSSHFLEHVDDAKAALKEWWRVLKVGGHLVLYLPHKDLYPNIGEPDANPDHKHDFVPDDITALMRDVGARGFTLKENEKRDQENEYSFFQVYEKRNDFIQVITPWVKPEKNCLVIRYGAFGDQIMAASILPGLKEQGYHVTYQTTPRGRDIVEHDPHIDAFMLQDKDQVPDDFLHEYWRRLGGRYDRIINLCESIEGSLLALPGRLNHSYPEDIRRRLYGSVNYLERTHDLAGVPHEFAAKFYATPEEKNWAKRERAKFDGPLIMWVLNGSALHKLYAWSQFVLGYLLRYSPVHIITVGDDGGKELELGYIENLQAQDVSTDKLHCHAGKLSIRQTMALAEVCDVVAGPETGVLNAVGLSDKVAKVVMLSHSSADNLTKHWKNTHVIEPPTTVSCYPCHRLHYSLDHCQTRDIGGKATGTVPWAACAADIDPHDIFEAIMGRLGLMDTIARKEAKWITAR